MKVKGVPINVNETLSLQSTLLFFVVSEVASNNIKVTSLQVQGLSPFQLTPLMPLELDIILMSMQSIIAQKMHVGSRLILFYILFHLRCIRFGRGDL